MAGAGESSPFRGLGGVLLKPEMAVWIGEGFQVRASEALSPSRHVIEHKLEAWRAIVANRVLEQTTSGHGKATQMDHAGEATGFVPDA